MRCLVTGGGGFIGSNIASRLLRDGHEVRVLDSFATGHRSNLDEGIELVEGDVQSYERVHRATRDVEVVFHQAALPSVLHSQASIELARGRLHYEPRISLREGLVPTAERLAVTPALSQP